MVCKFWRLIPLSVTSFANIFSHSVGCLFILFMIFFAMQKLLLLIGSHLFNLSETRDNLRDMARIFSLVQSLSRAQLFATP